MSRHELWNQRYKNASHSSLACDVLRNHAHLLPKHGTALDVACGLGGNALLLAHHGLQTFAWDFADNAIEALKQQAKDLPLYPEVRNVVEQPPAEKSFDVIVVSRFLERELAPALINALAPQGLLFYQTFSRTFVEDSPPRNPAFRLADNELLQLFSPLKVVFYQEEARIGDLEQGTRNEAFFIGQRV